MKYLINIHFSKLMFKFDLKFLDWFRKYDINF